MARGRGGAGAGRARARAGVARGARRFFDTVRTFSVVLRWPDHDRTVSVTRQCLECAHGKRHRHTHGPTPPPAAARACTRVLLWPGLCVCEISTITMITEKLFRHYCQKSPKHISIAHFNN